MFGTRVSLKRGTNQFVVWTGLKKMKNDLGANLNFSAVIKPAIKDKHTRKGQRILLCKRTKIALGWSKPLLSYSIFHILLVFFFWGGG